MNVTIVSAFRDSTANIERFIERVYYLEWLPGALRIICVEGDSFDDTRMQLHAWAHADPRVTVLRCDTGRPRYGSVVNAERFEILATVFNTGLAAVDLEWSDYVLFVPSDIEYDSDLLNRLVAHDKDIIAPFVYSNGVFYDIWGFSINGNNFTQFTPEQAFTFFGTDPVELDTAGCVMLMRSAVLKAGARYTLTDVDRGLCSTAKALGFHVWADPSTVVIHP